MNLKCKNYVHFDKRMNKKEAIKYLKDISSHDYLPFITYEIPKNKWDEFHNKLDEYRTVSIASHKDSYVYQYFNSILSEKYEKYLKNKNFTNSVCAYRKNKSNIKSAKKAFKFIKNSNECLVMVGDISKFFDNLDHKILKDNVKTVLNVDSLDIDMYKMLKSVTKASYVELVDIYRILRKENVNIFKIDKEKHNYFEIINSFCKEKNQQTIVKPELFHKYKSEILKPGKDELTKKTKGIVQGSSVSGTLANIYMINLDQRINDLISQYSGLYLRYSDDFIIAIPGNNIPEFLKLFNLVKSEINNEKLELKNSKVNIFSYANNQVLNLNKLIKKNGHSKKEIQFLGFVFQDDSVIDIRQGTKAKNHNKMLKSLKTNPKEAVYKRLEDSEKGDYRNYTFGNYISNSNNQFKDFEKSKIKTAKKKMINFIDKHSE